MLNILRRNWQILIVLVLCFWAVKTLLTPGYFPAHDNAQIAKLFEMDKALSDGQIPPRWVSELGFGYGYPVFNFYSPFIYYLGEAIHLIGFSLINSMKIVIVLGFLFSSLFMYLWSRNHFGKVPSIFAALIYVYAPYHAVDVYVRGDISEFFSFVLIPAIFWSLDLLMITKKNKSIFLLGLFIAILVLTHNLTVLMFAPFFILYTIYLYLNNGKKIVLPIVTSLMIAFGLSSYYSLPAILEKQYTLIDKVNVGELFYYKLHFVCVKEFFNSAWGYGGSLPDCMSGLSFELGKIQILILIFVFLILTYSLFKKRLSEFKLSVLILLMFLFSIYMANSHSQWIWDRVKLLSYLQFPWRFLLFSAVFSSFLGGFVVHWIAKKKGNELSIIIVLVLGAISLIMTSSNFQPQEYLSNSYFSYNNDSQLKWEISRSSFEYLPKGVATKLSSINTTQVDITKDDIPSQLYKVINGDVRVKVILNKSQLKSFYINSRGKSVLRINTFSFPGWKTFLDGKEIKYSDNNRLKLITVDIPPGSHTLTLEFVNTIPRAVGNAVSLVTVFNLIGFGIIKLWKR